MGLMYNRTKNDKFFCVIPSSHILVEVKSVGPSFPFKQLLDLQGFQLAVTSNFNKAF